ncbi:hypothetical protein DYH09_31295 [bacterium CPR1]|nr:hypothetical protein [bacterium CPR1]
MKRYLVAICAGALVGAVCGWFAPELHGLPIQDASVRGALAGKYALVVASMAYLVSMYLVMRRRAIDRWMRRG